jgi:hypothetical protein
MSGCNGGLLPTNPIQMNDWDTGLVCMPRSGDLQLCACLLVAGTYNTTWWDAIKKLTVFRQMIIIMVPRSGERLHLSLLETVLRHILSPISWTTVE